ncbi:MAG TPA: nitrilase-related carbon-nitrogen hydrolase, partial [Haliangium sp.]|nr:nitrilase-related carbon-nitrogen hydrolase [Haliangium sp.]
MSTDRVTVAAVQSSLTDDVSKNVARMTELVREAAGRGAHVILMPELFEGHYFPRAQREVEFAR